MATSVATLSVSFPDSGKRWLLNHKERINRVNMSSFNPLLITVHIIYLIGSILCAVFPFSGSRHRAPWARWSFFAAALLLMVTAVCGLAVDFHVPLPIRPETLIGLGFMIRGFVLGLFFALIASRELNGKKIVTNTRLN